MPITRNHGRLQHRLFTSNGTWTVPAGVHVIWVDAVAGGGAGAGGYASAVSGGGGAGGQPGQGVRDLRLPVAPGAVLTIVIGAGGTPGGVGVQGTGNSTVIDGLSGIKSTLILGPLGSAEAGTAAAGGVAYYNGAGNGSNQRIYAQYGGTVAGYSNVLNAVILQSAGFGGNPGGAGSFSGTYGSWAAPSTQLYATGGSPSSQLGGGGAGGHSPWGIGGNGGNGGLPGANAVGYGAGGGGGGCNAAGGYGSPGFVMIYWEG